MNSFRAWVERHALLVFYVLMFALSWWPWALYLRGTDTLPILPLGPMLAALIVAPLAAGRTGLLNLLRSVFRWRVNWRWYAVAIGFPIVGSAVAAGVNILMGASASTAAWPTSAAPLLESFLEGFLIVGLGEETGFSAFALPRYLRRRTVLITVLALALTRAVWHLPLFQSGETQWGVAVMLFPVQLIFTWIFMNSRGSTFLLILSHWSQNAFGYLFFTQAFTGADQARMVWLLAGVYIVLGAILLLASKSMRSALLSPGPGPEMEGDGVAVAVTP